jgi:multiple sugar transport system ATP-binding protein
VALSGLTLDVGDGELVVLVGPSGCGKTTVLRLVAGLESPTDGRVWLDGRDVTDLPPRERDVAMVFQNFALYPHKSVRDNLAFGLRMRRIPRPIAARRVEAVAEVLDLAGVLQRTPGQLSGGQRQRVALGRAIVREPRVFLLDEPLSSLDATLRTATRAEIARLHRRLQATMVYVTHDQEEAMTLGDRIAVLRDGHLQQLGAPLEVYRRPSNAFVAGFIGSPAMNLWPCQLARAGEGARLEGRGFAIPVPARLRPGQSALLMGIRPHDVDLVALKEAHAVARIEVVERLGPQTLLHATLEGGGGQRVRISLGSQQEPAVDEPVGLRFPAERLHLFDADSGSREPTSLP